MSEPTTQELIESMVGPSASRLGQLAASMAGVGAESVAMFRDISGAVSQLPGLGMSAAEKIRTTRADTSLPQDHRLKLVNETRDGTRAVLEKLHAGAQSNAVKLEGLLEDGLFPRPHRDVGQRGLTQSGIQARYRRFEGEQLVNEVLRNIGTNQSHDSELLSESFGRDFLQGAGATDDHLKAIRARAVESYMTRKDGTERQIASRRALVAYRAAKVPGAVTAHFQAARMHLGEDR
jgi:hypothetical protein